MDYSAASEKTRRQVEQHRQAMLARNVSAPQMSIEYAVGGKSAAPKENSTTPDVPRGDGDRAVLMSILLLLCTEQADLWLILALLYIAM